MQEKPLKNTQFLRIQKKEDLNYYKIPDKKFEPYQKKVIYKILSESSEDSQVSVDSEEAHLEEDQPFDTATRIGYDKLIK